MNGEVKLTLNWRGRLRALLTGKVKLSEGFLRYCLCEMECLRNEYED